MLRIYDYYDYLCGWDQRKGMSNLDFLMLLIYPMTLIGDGLSKIIVGWVGTRLFFSHPVAACVVASMSFWSKACQHSGSWIPGSLRVG